MPQQFVFSVNQTCLVIILLYCCVLLVMGQSSSKGQYPIEGTDSLMKAKQHGTCTSGVQQTLRWGCDTHLADKICCYNRHSAEHSGYFTKTSLNFMKFLVSG